MMIFFPVIALISLNSFASNLNTQQQYKMHSNLVQKGHSGYSTQSQSVNLQGMRYVPSQIVVNTQPQQQATQQQVLVEQPVSNQQPSNQQNSQTVPNVSPQGQIPPMQMQKPMPNPYNAYTGYPHYERNASMRPFRMPNQDFTKYYVLNLGSALSSSYNYQVGNKSYTLSNNNIVPILNKQGLGGIYVGRKINTAFGFSARYEYGGMWEVLSFNDETPQYSRTIYQHNIAGSLRGFIDIPISLRLAFTAGADVNYGVLSHIIAQDQIFTTGMSYGVMAGFSMKYTRSRSLFVLLRQGVIGSQNYKILNTTRPASFGSTSVIFGVQLASW